MITYSSYECFRLPEIKQLACFPIINAIYDALVGCFRFLEFEFPDEALILVCECVRRTINEVI